MQKRLNITLDEDLITRTDKFARNSGITRSALIAVALNEYMDAKNKEPEVSAAVAEFYEKLKSIVPNLDIKN